MRPILEHGLRCSSMACTRRAKPPDKRVMAMMNICFQCGIYRADKIIDPDGPVAICPECGYRHRFAQLPLLIVSGASGAGKSTVCHILLGRLTQVVVLDSDILWRSEFNLAEFHSPNFNHNWLGILKNNLQAGRAWGLIGRRNGVPGNHQTPLGPRYFAALHYLALVCDDQALAERLWINE